jgi:predicted metal-dependent hydrolase
VNYIQYGNRKINFEIKRGNRKKTVGIHVNPTASITVLSPRCLDEEKIRMILHKKARWIFEKQEQIKKNRNSNSEKQFVSGESFPYLGRYYRLKLMKLFTEIDGKCRLVNGRFLVEVNGKSDSESDRTAVKKALMDWYLEHAEDKIRERVSRLAKLIGKWPASIKIKNQEKRWGSCSRKGIIRFNWKIIMVPISIMDYVIVHELCHLIYPHHSSEFWQKVQSIISDYKKRRDWLKKNSLQMDSLG